MITIDMTSRSPIYEQLKGQIIKLAALGALKPNEQLPPVRQLAQKLAINPNTVQKAYAELERDGIIYSLQGKGSFISEGLEKNSELKRSANESLKKACESCLVAKMSKQDIIDAVTKICEEEWEND